MPFNSQSVQCCSVQYCSVIKKANLFLGYGISDCQIKRPPLQTGASRDNARASLADMTSSPGDMTSSPGDRNSPYTMNIRFNQSQQQERVHELYGAYAPQVASPSSGHYHGFNQSKTCVKPPRQSGGIACNFNQSSNGPQNFNQSSKGPQNFNQSMNGPQNFNQLGSGANNFSQSGKGAPNFVRSGDSPQKDGRALHRVLSCPNCSLLFDSSQAQGRCPGCNQSLGKEDFSERSSLSQRQFGLDDAAAKLPPSSPGQQMLLKDMVRTTEPPKRSLPEPPHVHGQSSHDNLYEDVDTLLEWHCEHCTFANSLSTKVCQACYKTPSDLNKFPSLVEVNVYFILYPLIIYTLSSS